jgi:hypothetical protein
MSDRRSLVLVSLLVLALGMDLLLLHSGVPLFLGRKLIDLTEYLTFWR